MRTLAIVVLSVMASMLGGCNADWAYVRVADPNAAGSFDGHLEVGQRLDVTVVVSHSEIEGSSHLEAVTLETSDLHVVRTEPGGHGFYLFGIAPGKATIHATTDGFPTADFVVTVEAAQ